MLLDEILSQMRASPDRPAYSVGGLRYTYGELEQFTGNLCRLIREANPDRRPVAVFGHKDAAMKAAFLACSFAGAAYAPIDDHTPPARVRQILTDLRPGLILGDAYLDGVRTVPKAELEAVMRREPPDAIGGIALRPDDDDYIIFTSGSTGSPKGVRVRYRNLDSCVQWLKSVCGEGRNVILNQANFSFDLSVADLYLSLATGSEHVALEREVQADFPRLFAALAASRAEMLVATPSFADYLLLDRGFNRALMPDLKLILFCGEKLRSRTVSRLFERFDGLRIVNSYGPTECTFAVTAWDVRPEDCDREIPAGTAKPGVWLHILDEADNELPDGAEGEILIAGNSVAAGYLGGGTGFCTWQGREAYRTGDLGRLEGGVLYVSGRKDRQIKYKGYRVEPGEIEAALLALPGVSEARVLPKKAADGTVLRLLGFVTMRPGEARELPELREALRVRLPAYMCPAVRVVARFPLTENGKCDEKRLMEME